MNIHEIRTFAAAAEELLKEGQLQEVLTNDRGLALGFYRERMHWLVIDLTQPAPFAVLLEDSRAFRKSPKAKPVGLFLSSHARNLFFVNCEVLEQWGRVLLLRLAKGERACEIEIHLIPKQANLIVREGAKSISWEKPRELKPAAEIPEMEVRSLRQLRDEWLRTQAAPTANRLDPLAQWEKQRQKDLQKKTRAAEEIEKQLAEDKSARYFALGEHLKTYGMASVPPDTGELVDPSQTLSWNIENAFAKAKQLEQKRAGTEERLHLLRGEIQALQQASYQPARPRTGLDDLMGKTEARGRKLHLEGGALAYCGRSGADNLALLRQAKAWDYWLHLRDYPGAHAIIHRQRDQKIPEAELQRVALWLAKESLSAKSLMVGQRFAVVWVECRFVKPIKGDKLGRVTYHSEKAFTVTYA